MQKINVFTRNCKVSNDFSRKLSGENSREYFSYEIKEDFRNTVREFDFYGSSESSYDDMGTREKK